MNNLNALVDYSSSRLDHLLEKYKEKKYRKVFSFKKILPATWIFMFLVLIFFRVHRGFFFFYMVQVIIRDGFCLRSRWVQAGKATQRRRRRCRCAGVATAVVRVNLYSLLSFSLHNPSLCFSLTHSLGTSPVGSIRTSTIISGARQHVPRARWIEDGGKA